MPASFSIPIPTLLLWGYFLKPRGSYNLVKGSEACGDVGPSCSIPILPAPLQVSLCLSLSVSPSHRHAHEMCTEGPRPRPHGSLSLLSAPICFVTSLLFPPCPLPRVLFISKKFSSVQFSSVAQACPTLCHPMNCSTPGLSVHHQLPEFTQTHVH